MNCTHIYALFFLCPGLIYIYTCVYINYTHTHIYIERLKQEARTKDKESQHTHTQNPLRIRTFPLRKGAELCICLLSVSLLNQ